MCLKFQALTDSDFGSLDLSGFAVITQALTSTNLGLVWYMVSSDLTRAG